MHERRRKVAVFTALLLLLALPVITWGYVLANGKRVDAANVVSGLLAPLAITVGSVIQLWSWHRSQGNHAMDTQLDAATAELARQSHLIWRKEAFFRGITASAPLRVSWRWTIDMTNFSSAADVSGPMPPGTGPPRMPVVGRRPRLATRGALYQLHDLYRRLDHGRLVVLGEKGAGKTGALILVLLAALDYRSEVDEADRAAVPIPVLLPVANWDPRTHTLFAWAGSVILRDHSYLKSTSYGRDVVQDLLRSGRVSLFLDGFDEMPGQLRALALRHLNEETGLRIVLTSRTDEYKAAAEQAVFAHSAVVDLLPVGAKAAADYLLRGQVDARKDLWRRFTDQLVAEPSGPVAEALSRPLPLTLVKKVYADHGDPIEMFDGAAFRTPDDITHHLIGAVLPTAYPDPAEMASATRFLVWIAKSMHARQTRDLIWWRIRYWVTPWLPPVVASFCFGGLGVLIGVLARSTSFGLAFGLCWFACAGATSAAIVARGASRAVSLRGALPRLTVAVGLGLLFGGGVALVRVPASGLAGSVAVGGLLGVLFGVTSGLLVGLVALHDGPLVSKVRWPRPADIGAGVTTGGMTGIGASLVSDAVVQVAVAIVGGLGFTTTVAWTRPTPHPQDEVNAVAAYRGDRRGGILFSVVAGLFTGLGVGIGAALSLGVERGVLIGVASAMGAGVAGAVTASQVAAFRVVMVPLFFRGRAPRRPMAFLADAYERQILRQVGTIYQFRHAELQDYLSSRPEEHRASRRRLPRT